MAKLVPLNPDFIENFSNLRRSACVIMDGSSIAKMLMDRSSRVAAKTELEALDKVAKQRATNALVARFQDASDLNEFEMVLDDTTGKLRSVSAAVDSTYAKHD